jgi:hypothetical protein
MQSIYSCLLAVPSRVLHSLAMIAETLHIFSEPLADIAKYKKEVCHTEAERGVQMILGKVVILIVCSRGIRKFSTLLQSHRGADLESGVQEKNAKFLVL